MRRIPARLAALAGCVVCAAFGQEGPDRFFDSGGVRIRYQVSGSGPAVVLVHGFGETLERWGRTQASQVLSPHFQVIVFDIRAHGRSGKPHDPQAYGPELASDVVRLLEHLGIGKAHIVGYSMGALVGLDMALLHPRHVASLVLGGAGWNPPETLESFRRQAEAFEQWKAPIAARADAKALGALLRGLRVLTESEVRSIQVPMAAIIGVNDRFLGNVRRLSAIRPDVKVEIIPEADHATAVTHPRFAEALLEFLKLARLSQFGRLAAGKSFRISRGV